MTLVYRGTADNASEAVITYKKQWLYGRVTLGAARRHFVIETVPGDGMVVWAEINQGVWNDERRPPPKMATMEEKIVIPQDRVRELLAKVSRAFNPFIWDTKKS